MIDRRLDVRCLRAYALLVLLAAPLSAQESAPTVAEYEAIMKEIDYTLGDAELHVDALYWADLGTDTDALRSLFARVHTFWSARAESEAVGLVERVLTANRALSRASAESDKAAAGRAVGEIRAACKACHTQYRERTEDGYRIKPHR